MSIHYYGKLIGPQNGIGSPSLFKYKSNRQARIQQTLNTSEGFLKFFLNYLKLKQKK